MATDHAPIAPSSLWRTVECNAWIQLAASLPPEPEGPEAAEGTAGHEVALAKVDGYNLRIGDKTKNGVVITQEMVDGAELWASVVPEGAVCEEKLPRISRIHPTECWGTPDGWRYYPERKFLWSGDYKFGHRYVEVFDSYQGVGYVAGILELLGLNDLEIDVQFDIVQPRWYGGPPVRSWHFKASDIRAHVNIAKQAAERALGPDPVATAGPQCLNCPAAGVCTTLQRAGAEAIEYSSRGQAHALEGPALAYELMLLERLSKTIEARQTGLEEQAKAMLARGASIPGVMLERSVTRLKWNDDVKVDDVATLGMLAGVDLIKPREPITPTQAKAKGLADGLVNQYASRPPGAFKLKLDPDNITTRKLFGANANG